MPRSEPCSVCRQPTTGISAISGKPVCGACKLTEPTVCDCLRSDCEHYRVQVEVAQVHVLMEIATWLERIDDALRNTVGGR